jgi:hypothetical protein
MGTLRHQGVASRFRYLMLVLPVNELT